MEPDSDHDPQTRAPKPASQRSARHPTSRLSPPIELETLAREIARADEMLAARTGAQLQVIAEQLRSLQAQAREILEEARRQTDLNHAHCPCTKVPGRVYHLYRHGDGRLQFSLLSPADWGDRPPHAYAGAFRLEADLSWTPLDKVSRGDERDLLIQRLLAAGTKTERL